MIELFKAIGALCCFFGILALALLTSTWFWVMVIAVAVLNHL